MGDQLDTMGLLTRETAAADLELIGRWEADPDTAPWLGATGRGWHESALADPTQISLVSADPAGPVGFAVFARLDQDDIELRRMVVLPQRRGLGLGRWLLQAMLGHALDRHPADGVWLDVKRGNARARALYRSAGFEVVGSLGDAHPNTDGTSSDLIMMSRRGPYRP